MKRTACALFLSSLVSWSSLAANGPDARYLDDRFAEPRPFRSSATTLSQLFEELSSQTGLAIIPDASVDLDARIDTPRGSFSVEDVLDRTLRAGGLTSKVFDEAALVVFPDDARTRFRYDDRAPWRRRGPRLGEDGARRVSMDWSARDALDGLRQVERASGLRFVFDSDVQPRPLRAYLPARLRVQRALDLLLLDQGLACAVFDESTFVIHPANQSKLRWYSRFPPALEDLGVTSRDDVARDWSFREQPLGSILERLLARVPLSMRPSEEIDLSASTTFVAQRTPLTRAVHLLLLQEGLWCERSGAELLVFRETGRP